MKVKTILRREWRGIRARSYAETRFDLGHCRGIAGLLRQDEADFFGVRFGSGRRQITGDGYCWLQLALEDERVWATVMFDEEGNVFECYFDISAGNTLQSGGQSSFVDRYLDVVIRPDSEEMYFYDEDELLDACAQGEITEKEKEDALKARARLLASVKTRKREFFDQCRLFYEELSPLLQRVTA